MNVLPPLWIAISAATLLCACSSGPSHYDSPTRTRDANFWCVPALAPETGRLWIYRTAPKGIGVPPTIVVDGVQRDSLLHGTAYIIDMSPGRHQVQLAYDKDKIDVEITASENTFVRFDLDPSLVGRGFYPTLVDRQTAEVEVHEHTGTDFTCKKP